MLGINHGGVHHSAPYWGEQEVRLLRDWPVLSFLPSNFALWHLEHLKHVFLRPNIPDFPQTCAVLHSIVGFLGIEPTYHYWTIQAIKHWPTGREATFMQRYRQTKFIHIHSFVGCLSLNYLGRMVSWCGPVHPIKLPRHVQIVSSYGQDDHPLCVCVRSCDIVIYYVYIHKRTYMHATPQNKTVFFFAVCMQQPWDASTHFLVVSIAGETLCGLYCWRNTVWTLPIYIYIYIRIYIYTVYIYMYMYMYMYMLTPPIPTLKHFLGRIYVVIFVY